MALDQTQNFIRGSVAASIGSSDTTISVSDASVYPDPSNGEYNLVLWDSQTYNLPVDDPDVEIVRVTARDTTNDDLTVTRGQENTTAASHPSSSELLLDATAKMFGDIESAITLRDIDVQDSGSSVVSPLRVLNLGANLTVTDDGNGEAVIDADSTQSSSTTVTDLNSDVDASQHDMMLQGTIDTRDQTFDARDTNIRII